ncbi:MAG: ERF family protein, partial [Candidatus Hydrothermia bacterium]
KEPAIDDRIFQLAEKLSQAGVEAVKELFSLRQKIVEEQARKEFYEALRKVQEQLPAVPRSRVVLNQSGTVRYRYATFDDMLRIVKPYLTQNRFSFSYKTRIEGNQVYVRCELYHEGGHNESCEVALPVLSSPPGMNPAQAAGAVLTYAKRYSLSMLLGISEEEDTDANLNTTLVGDQVIVHENPKPPSQPVKREEPLKEDEKVAVERQKLRIQASEILKNAFPESTPKQRTEMWHQFLLKHYGVMSSTSLTIETLREAIEKLREEVENMRK